MCGRLFQGVQLRAVEVLEQRVTKQVVVRRLADDGGMDVSSAAREARAALAHDELVCPVVVLPHDDRLQHTELADAVDELREVVGVEGAWLARVRDDVAWPMWTRRALDLDELGRDLDGLRVSAAAASAARSTISVAAVARWMPRGRRRRRGASPRCPWWG